MPKVTLYCKAPYLLKEFELSFIPRQGESLVIAETEYVISKIVHVPETNEVYVGVVQIDKFPFPVNPTIII